MNIENLNNMKKWHKLPQKLKDLLSLHMKAIILKIEEEHYNVNSIFYIVKTLKKNLIRLRLLVFQDLLIIDRHRKNVTMPIRSITILFVPIYRFQ